MGCWVGAVTTAGWLAVGRADFGVACLLFFGVVMAADCVVGWLSCFRFLLGCALLVVSLSQFSARSSPPVRGAAICKALVDATNGRQLSREWKRAM